MSTSRFSSQSPEESLQNEVQVLRARLHEMEISQRRLKDENSRLLSEPQKTQAALRQSEERYRAFVQNSSEAIWRFELEKPIPIHVSEEEQIRQLYDYGYLAECNEAMAKMYGFDSIKEIIGTRITDLMIPDDPHNIEYLRRFIRSGYRLADAESKEHDIHGKTKYFLNNFFAIIEDGFIIRAWGSQRDITERRLKEEWHRKLEKRLETQYAVARILAESRTLSETINATLKVICEKLEWEFGAFWLKEDQNQLKCSETYWHKPQLADFDRATRSLGFSKGIGFPGKVWSDASVIWMEDVLENLRPFPRHDSAKRAGFVSGAAFPICLNGEMLAMMEFFGSDRRTAETETLEVLNAIGSQIGMFIERHHVTEALRLSEKRFRIAAECGSDLVYEWDLLRNEIKWFGDIDHCLVFEPDESPSSATNFLERIHPEDRDRVREALKRHLQNNVPYFEEYRIKCKNGSYIYWTDKGKVLRDADGKPYKLIGVNSDVTERRLAEKKILEANQELTRLNLVRSEFISMVSHELRTPLAVIKEGINILIDEVDGPITAAQRETLSMSKNNVDRLARLIQNVLDFTKIEAGKLKMQMELANLNAVVAEIYNFMRIATQKKGVEFKVTLPDDTILLMCDTDKVRQVLINLLDNAIKFTEKQGCIHLGLENGERHARLVIEDTGVGIAVEDQKRIFEMFEQSPSGENMRHAGGVGVGLAVCKKLIELHGGRISLESIPGRGSKFVVTFPKQELPENMSNILS